MSKQIEFENPDLKQQINFIGRVERNEGATMFFIMEISEESTFECLQNSVTVAYLYAIYINGNSKDCKFIELH